MQRRNSLSNSKNLHGIIEDIIYEKVFHILERLSEARKARDNLWLFS
jgi:hypothetical protein